jgi:hypothetical protein
MEREIDKRIGDGERIEESRWKERRRKTNGERAIERDLREKRSCETGRRSRARQQDERRKERATTEETTVRESDGDDRAG